MDDLSRLIRPKASAPPLAMGCLTMLFLFPLQILLLPVTLIGRLMNEAANRWL